MSTASRAQSTASRAANSSALEGLTRAGFIGYGIVHLLFAWLALQIAFGKPAAEGDQSGALMTLAQQPLGKFLVVAIAVGLLAMAIWQLSEALIGHQDEQGKRRVFERIASAFRTVVYAYFAYTAWKVFKGAPSSAADSQQKKTEDLLSSGGGRAVVIIAGLALAGLGIGLVVYGVKKVFERHLKTGQMSPSTRQLSRRLGMAGYSAKGVAYGIAGVLFVVAAATYDPQKARGLDAALETLRGQAYGAILLTLMALGIAAFGLFCFLQSKYRKV
ncbi:DUF1206 domain-containing protein [Asanoa sp. WMMD1127]|uniref:DUF1206 domain-containing protein n=1 Tax=Asanoa sp. WMMD1127 TaxID=3016107 RepID=UPI002415D8CB|nr:DUF1206 domain-containing protein [Asanoa sp. WMMD1127]MDG4824355.1 DUF1206 domain-containing protein [Asanoa sp. WMMD1127]